MGIAADRLSAELLARGPCTPRESDVLLSLCHGHPVKAIARRLGCSEKTVGAHLERLRMKLGANSILQVALIAVADGLVRVGRGAAGLAFVALVGWQIVGDDAIKPKSTRHHRAGARVSYLQARCAGRPA